MKLGVILAEKEPFSPKGGAFAIKSYELSKRLKGFDKIVIFSKAPMQEAFKVPGVKHVSIFFGRVLNQFPKMGMRYLLEVCMKLCFSRFDVFLIFNRVNYVDVLRKIKPKSKIYLYIGNSHIVNEKKEIAEKMLKAVSGVLCVSGFIKKEIDNKYPQFSHKTFFLPQGININEFSPGSGGTKDCLTILFVGRLNHDKGVHILLEAYRKIIKKYPHTKLKIVGSSWFGSNEKTEYTESLQELAQGLEENIIFTGFVPNNKISEVYKTADIFVAPSIFLEPAGMMNMEAMASGIPVITTLVGGIPELVKDAGILVDSDNVEATYNALVMLIENPSLREELSKKGRYRVEKKFDWDKVIHNWENALIDYEK